MDKIDQLVTAAAVQDPETAARLLSEAAPGGSCAVRDLALAARQRNPSVVAVQIDMDGTKEKITIARTTTHAERPVASITLERCKRN